MNKMTFCIVLLILFAAKTSFAINPHVMDSVRVHHYDSSEKFTAHQPNLKEQKMLQAQVIKEAKSLNRSDRFVKKIVQKSYKSQRPGNGKRVGWFILSIIVGVGLLMATALSVFLYGFLRSEGDTGAGWALGVGFVFAILFSLIFASLLRWDKTYPGNKSVKS